MGIHGDEVCPDGEWPKDEGGRIVLSPVIRLSTADQEELLADYLPYGESIQAPSTVKGVPACRDPNDLPFQRLAIKAHADYLVTGDADLLDVRANCPVPVVTPAELKSLFR